RNVVGVERRQTRIEQDHVKRVPRTHLDALTIWQVRHLAHHPARERAPAPELALPSRSSSPARAIAAAVVRPDIILAISDTRSSPSTRRTVLSTASPPPRRETRRFQPAREAISGRWVTARTWRPRPISDRKSVG